MFDVNIYTFPHTGAQNVRPPDNSFIVNSTLILYHKTCDVNGTHRNDLTFYATRDKIKNVCGESRVISHIL